MKHRLNSFFRFLSESQLLIAVFVHFCRTSCFFIPVAMNLCSTSFQQYTNILVGQMNMFNFNKRSNKRSISYLVCCSTTFFSSSILITENFSQQSKTSKINHQHLLTFFSLSFLIVMEEIKNRKFHLRNTSENLHNMFIENCDVFFTCLLPTLVCCFVSFFETTWYRALLFKPSLVFILKIYTLNFNIRTNTL